MRCAPTQSNIGKGASVTSRLEECHKPGGAYTSKGRMGLPLGNNAYNYPGNLAWDL